MRIRKSATADGLRTISCRSRSGLAIRESGGKGAVHRRIALGAPVQHDEVVAEAMHLDEGDAHNARALCAAVDDVQ